MDSFRFEHNQSKAPTFVDSKERISAGNSSAPIQDTIRRGSSAGTLYYRANIFVMIRGGENKTVLQQRLISAYVGYNRELQRLNEKSEHIMAI